jgi:hypothetical protein
MVTTGTPLSTFRDGPMFLTYGSLEMIDCKGERTYAEATLIAPPDTLQNIAALSVSATFKGKHGLTFFPGDIGETGTYVDTVPRNFAPDLYQFTYFQKFGAHGRSGATGTINWKFNVTFSNGKKSTVKGKQRLECI